MFRRRAVLFRRPRLLGAALVGGLGFAAGRASKATVGPSPMPRPGGAAGSPGLAASLRELSDLHAAGSLSDDEFTAAKAKLLS